ncbi:MAG: primosomal protein N' [Dehalococcoidales bacterium]|nr:primosomal protein N' [Dehalococcoidales bacterium]
MTYAEVSVNSAFARNRTFSYSIPPELDVKAGQAVWVPFGEKILQGIVIELTPSPAIPETKDVIGIIETDPVLSPEQIDLARWLSEYYLADLFDAVALMLPPGFERKVLTFLEATPRARSYDLATLKESEQSVLTSVLADTGIPMKKLEIKLGKKQASTAVIALVRQGLLTRRYELEPVRVKARQESFLSLLINKEDALKEAAALRQNKTAAKQAVLLESLCQLSLPAPLASVRQAAGGTPALFRALKDNGFIAIKSHEVKREPISYDNITPSLPFPLTPAQQDVLAPIQASLREGKPAVFLLHGVTGSGKTEIYLQALADVVKQGKRGIVLVPEIALTPQTIEHFAARFAHRVAVLHSRLSLGEQFDEWYRIKHGEFDVVIGSRSAIFAPQPNLGIIIIDEEHEWTYKQTEPAPRYHARDTAVKLAGLTGATVVLGSATPDIGSYYRAQQGEYYLLRLPERIVGGGTAPLPEVEIIDMKAELTSGNRSIFSRALTDAAAKALAGGEQVIFFLNRRGTATFIRCGKCGLVLRCKRCEATLTYHAHESRLICHRCNYQTPVPQSCPRCFSRRLKFLGVGTQKLEEETAAAFPQGRRLRWDSDVTTGKDAHEKILHKFRAHEADILIGTQMIAKGLDLPSVTLVGVVSADTALHLPDFRAGERTFQLLSQVAGRAGRGPAGGKVIIQTFFPEHYAIQAAAKHDYAAFYEKELEYRRQLSDPPFRQLALLTCSHTNNTLCQREAERMLNYLIAERDARGIAGLNLLGPAPAFFPRRRGRYRWQIILRGSELSPFLAKVDLPQNWTVDIDPVSTIQ